MSGPSLSWIVLSQIVDRTITSYLRFINVSDPGPKETTVNESTHDFTLSPEDPLSFRLCQDFRNLRRYGNVYIYTRDTDFTGRGV